MKRVIDPELLRSVLSVGQGKRYWRSPEELMDDPAFRAALEREFPDMASELPDGPSRRRFLALMGASLALAGINGCQYVQPPEVKIVPYVMQPEGLVLGKPLYYATTFPLSGYGCGLLVESHEGRPTKIEGNPTHPASLGGTSAYAQASVLNLYDPERSQTITHRGAVRPWGELVEVIRGRLNRKEGKQIAILTEALSSPTLDWQLAEFRKEYQDKIKWAVHEPAALTGRDEGAAVAFGKPVEVVLKVEQTPRLVPAFVGEEHHPEGEHVAKPRSEEVGTTTVLRADVIVALDSDFLNSGPGHLAYARGFAARRRQGGKETKYGLNRLYSIESTFSVTGGNADNRLSVRPAEVELFTRALAAKLELSSVEAPKLSEEQTRWVEEIAKDLKGREKGTTLIVPGDGQPVAVHILAHAINDKLGNLGKTVEVLPAFRPGHGKDGPDWTLAHLTEAIQKKEVDTLLIFSGNPVYTAPGDVPFKSVLTDRLAQDNEWLVVRLGSHFDETSRLSHWHIPESHYLETWSDALAYDGTASVVQPLIAPLYSSKSAHEIFAALTHKKIRGPGGDAKPITDYDERPANELVKAYWRDVKGVGKSGFEKFWEKSLHDGVLAGTAPRAEDAKFSGDLAKLGPAPKLADGYDLVLLPDPAVYDGRFGNNGWLQEMPKPITKLTWDNAALMSFATARKLGVRTLATGPAGSTESFRGGEHGDSLADMVRVKLGDHTVEMAAFVVPGHPDGVLTLHLGYGRTHAGKTGNGAGFDVYPLRKANGPAFLSGAEVSKADRTYRLACTQGHWNMYGRDPVRSSSKEEFEKDPYFATRTLEEMRQHAHRSAHPKSEGGEEHEGKELGAPSRKHSLSTLYNNAGTPEGDPFQYHTYKWGMAVDLSACTGCSACVIACQSENNIPVIGKDQVTRGREMHWMRIDRYFQTAEKDSEPIRNPNIYFQPVMCQHCENAPCELVCPVEATNHGDEGTNDMIYNRCVGTRYCANNCPYKVRRFNFYQFSDYVTASLKLMNNPEVTVRTRGVMEKCSFCIQRIAYARIEAAKEALDELELPEAKRKRFDPKRTFENGTKHVAVIHDGEVVTACQAACPSEAIVFGDLNDKKSRVARLQDSTLAYGLLAELGTRPRVAYLGSVRNANPALEKK
jgi:MoCo/4Fe-4S cofactor protein with predicted Tat translocation signal